MTLQEILKKMLTGNGTEEDDNYYREHFMSEEEIKIGKPIYAMNDEEEMQFMALSYNSEAGNLQGYDCAICNNKGDIHKVKDGRIVSRDCVCLSIRRTIYKMEKSGLGNLLKLYTFDKYERSEAWQESVYERAQAFLRDTASFFYYGGSVGCGKSMICTAIVKELLKKGVSTKYMLWNDESLELKQSLTDNEKYATLMNELKKAQCLYIDDLFKREPTKADLDIAFEIINYRYNMARMDKTKRYITIISSEKSINDLLTYDEAVGSRIFEMTKPNYYLYIKPDLNKNYRMK